MCRTVSADTADAIDGQLYLWCCGRPLHCVGLRATPSPRRTVLRMKLRAVVAGVLLMVGMLVWLVVDRREEALAGDVAWQREDAFINASNRDRLGKPVDAPFHDSQVAADEVHALAPLRILLLGDSNTAGHGVADLDMRWGVRLEDELNDRTEPGTFEVVHLARSGTSTMLHAERLSEEILNEVDPDLLVLAYYQNDFIPTGAEQRFCDGDRRDCDNPPYVELEPAFSQCPYALSDVYEDPVDRPTNELVGTEVAADQVEGQCRQWEEQFREDSALPSLYDPEVADPHGVYWPLFLDAIDELVDTAGNTPLVGVPVDYRQGNQWRTDAIGAALAEVGVPSAQMHHLQQLREQVEDDTELWVIPSNSHPGSRATAALARDGAEAITSWIFEDQLVDRVRARAAAATAQPAEFPLVSNHLPVQLDVSATTDTATVRNPAPPAGAADAEAGDEHFSQLHSWQFSHGGRQLPPQLAPCAPINRPHAQVMLDRRLSDGTQVTLAAEHVDGSTRGSLDVYTVGYDADDLPTITAHGRLRAGAELDIATGDGVSGVLLASRSSSGCAPGEMLEVEPFEVTLSVRSD